ncbi:MAG TPA: LacI family DNA-binding transcriptional regulator [Jatrophihabitans sp.]|nr:LacI family DNA-binding transcriptional regulator [Jatrophihabitans sp.]
MSTPPTLRDVAAHAGVHVSTASRVIRGEHARVRPDTVERVLASARQLGFQRNRWAAGLRSGRTGVIGVLVPRITDVVLATLFEAIEQAASEAGYQAVVASSWDDPEIRQERVARYRAERVDGMIFGDARTSDSLLRGLAAESVPFVLVSRTSRGLPGIAGKDRAGGGMVAQHLVELGCRNLAVIAGPDYASTATDRVTGFLATALRCGSTVRPELVVNSTFDVDGGYRAMQVVLSRQVPDGVFAVNDFAAIGAIGALREHGLEIGRDVALVGYNDISVAAQLPTPLTSVRTPLDDMGRAAFAALVQRMGGAPVQSMKLAPTLIVRESTLAFSRARVPS